jgi:hypothetical protein
MPKPEPEANNADIEVMIKALSHHVRRQVLRMMNASATPLSPKTAAKQGKRPIPNVAYHFRVLDGAGLISLVSRRSVRGAIEHLYCPNAQKVGHPIVQAALAATD